MGKKKPNKNYGDCKYSSNFKDGWDSFSCDCIKKDKCIIIDIECMHCIDFKFGNDVDMEE